MIKDGKGGANTNKIGLIVEQTLLKSINDAFNVNDRILLKTLENFTPQAIVGQKSSVYRWEQIGLKFDKPLIEKIKYQPQPDVFIFFPKLKHLWIIEIKNQDTSGTGWEKFEFGLFGYKKDVYQRIFKDLKVMVEGVYSGKHWDKIQYLPDVKQYIKRTYSKKLFGLSEINELINTIKNN